MWFLPKVSFRLHCVVEDGNNNDGVYHCGFAGSQEHYEEAYDRLWAAMDWLDQLSDNPWGEGIALDPVRDDERVAGEHNPLVS